MKYKVPLYMTIVIAVWGLTATVEAVSLTSLSPFQFTAWSTAFGAVGAAVWTIFSGRPKQLIVNNRLNLFRIFVLSLLGFGIYFILKYTAYTISPIPQANVLQYTFTIFIVIFAVPVMHQPLTFVKLMAVVIGFTGAVIVMTGGGILSVESTYIPGYLCALGAGVSFALFSVLVEKYRLYGIHMLFYFHGFSAVILFLVLAAQGELIVPGSVHEIGGIFYSGFISNVLGMQFWLSAQSETDDVSVLTGILYVVPFVSLLCFKVFLNLPIPASAYTGLTLIVAGMSIHHFRRVLRSTAVRSS